MLGCGCSGKVVFVDVVHSEVNEVVLQAARRVLRRRMSCLRDLRPSLPPFFFYLGLVLVLPLLERRPCNDLLFNNVYDLLLIFVVTLRISSELLLRSMFIRVRGRETALGGECLRGLGWWFCRALSFAFDGSYGAETAVTGNVAVVERIELVDVPLLLRDDDFFSRYCIPFVNITREVVNGTHSSIRIFLGNCPSSLTLSTPLALGTQRKKV